MSISFSELVNELKREYHRKFDGDCVERNIDDLSNFELLFELVRIEELLKEKNT